MAETRSLKNPFTVTSPEDMPATEAHSLFVDVFTDYPKIRDEGHTFLHGPRGSGKSMMFRYLMPDCQAIENDCGIRELPFYGIYVRIKNTELQITELQRLEGKHASYILNEHFMVTHFAEIVFNALLGECECQIDNENKNNVDSINNFFSGIFERLLLNCGWAKDESYGYPFQSVSDCLVGMYGICNTIYSQVKHYFRKLAFYDDIIPYDGPLCSYLDFLFPLLRELRTLPFLPAGPIFLFIDDADNLSMTQTKILNSWVFTRSSSEVSLKISTQLDYKTFHTIAGKTIDTPHDYSEVNISTIYTSKKNKYLGRVKEIIDKRLKLSNINITSEEFFPVNEKQEEKILKIGQKLREKWNKGEGKGHRPSDDVVRYARVDYIKSRAGSLKSSHTYSYAGFYQQVHLSSGIIRYFLDAAKQMYSEVVADGKDQHIEFIPHNIQNKVSRKKAEEFLFDELGKKRKDQAVTEMDDKLEKLYNLIHALGGLFRKCLLSSRSERKVFSFAFSSQPPDELREVIELGEKYGYFHKSTIGRKDSRSGGRTRLYILSRRLAPIYTLDPTGFAGYLFIKGDFLAEALYKPDSLLRRIKDPDDLEKSVQPQQLRLFQ